MASKKSKGKSSGSKKLNWNNNKVDSIAKHFLFADGRLSKDDILKLSNQTLFTKLKSGGYIKEVENGEKLMFKTTDKFRKEYRLQSENKTAWKASGGSVHAQGMNNLSKIVPKTVIDEGRFKTGESLKNELDKLKSKQSFKQEAKNLLDNKREEIANKELNLKTQLENAKSEKQANYYKAVHDAEMKKLQIELRSLEEKNFKGFSAPDTRIEKMTRTEAGEMLENLRNSFNQYHQRNHEMLQEAVQKLEQTIEQSQSETISLSIEVYTDNYKYEDKCSHQNYEMATGNTTIYLPSK